MAGFEDDYQNKYGQTPSQQAATQIKTGGMESYYSGISEEEKKKKRQELIVTAKPPVKQPTFFETAKKKVTEVTKGIIDLFKAPEIKSPLPKEKTATELISQIKPITPETNNVKIIKQKNIFDVMSTLNKDLGYPLPKISNVINKTISKISGAEQSIFGIKLGTLGQNLSDLGAILSGNTMPDQLKEYNKLDSWSKLNEATKVFGALPPMAALKVPTVIEGAKDIASFVRGLIGGYGAGSVLNYASQEPKKRSIAEAIKPNLDNMIFGYFTGLTGLPNPFEFLKKQPEISKADYIEARNFLNKLGVDESIFSKPKALKKSYFDLVKKYHPDIPNTGNAEIFKGINDAYKKVSTTFYNIKSSNIPIPKKNEIKSSLTDGVEFFPDALKDNIKISNLDGTKAGDTLLRVVDQAKKEGSNLKIYFGENNRTFNVTTPDGNKIGVDLLKPLKASIGGGKKPLETNLPTVIAKESKTNEKLDKAISNYRSDQGVTISPDKKVNVSPALKELTKLSEDPEVIKSTQDKVSKLPVDDNGKITLYRVGTIRENDNRLISASYTKEAAQAFKESHKEIFGDRPVTTFKVAPGDIKVFMGGTEQEVLVKNPTIISQPPVEGGVSVLAQEAKKYKTVDEFLRQKITLPIESVDPRVSRETILKSREKIESRTPNEPVTVKIVDGKPQILNGVQRYYQKLDSGAKTIDIVFTPYEDQGAKDFYNKVKSAPSVVEGGVSNPSLSPIEKKTTPPSIKEPTQTGVGEEIPPELKTFYEAANKAIDTGKSLDQYLVAFKVESKFETPKSVENRIKIATSIYNKIKISKEKSIEKKSEKFKIGDIVYDFENKEQTIQSFGKGDKADIAYFKDGGGSNISDLKLKEESKLKLSLDFIEETKQLKKEVDEEKKPIEKEKIVEKNEQIIDKFLKDTYGTDLKGATKKQIAESLYTTGSKIFEPPDKTLLQKIGNSSTDIKLFDSRPLLFYGGIERHMYTNGYFLILDKQAADKINSDVLDKIKKRGIKTIQRSKNITFDQASKSVEDEVRNYKKEAKTDYPDEYIKKLIDKLDLSKSTREEARIQGYYNSRASLISKNKRATVNYDYLAELYKYIPGAKIYITENDQPVQFLKDNELVAVLMPIRDSEDSNPFGKDEKPPSGYSGSGMADVGGYLDIKSTKKQIENIRALEFPEILRIAKELLGNTPTLKPFRRALGMFYGNPLFPQIKLNPSIFKDPVLAAKVLAHELGHLTDFLPDKTTKRGNLLGRIASLNSYRKSFLEEFSGSEKGLLTDEDKKRLRAEAKELAKKPIKVEEEVIVGETKAKPEQILSIWNDLDAGKKFPELQKYISTLSTAQKVEIVKHAIRGTVPEWIGFKTYIKKTVITEVIKNAPADIKKVYEKLLREELQKRNLFYVNEVRDELKKMTQLWKPFVEELVPASYKKYRYSGPELYADAISVLFNDPALLKETAPEFYRGFFNYLDNKPEAKKNFEETSSLLNEGEEAVFKRRDEELSRSFNEGDKGHAVKHLDKQKIKTSLLYQIKLLFDDKNTPILEKINQLRKAGKEIPADLNPDYALKDLLYGEGKIKNYVEDNFQPIFEKSQEVSDGWNKLGKIIFYERVMNERGQFANPQGYDPYTASSNLLKMEEFESPEDWKKLQEAKDLFRNAVKESNDFAEKNGYYTPELLKQIKANPAYATFQVVDYLDTYISARIFKQKGTLKDIANPATSTVMKLMSLRKAIERNNAKKLNVEFLKTFFSSTIEKALTRWNGKSMDIKPPKDLDSGLVITIENGKPQGYYVERDVADMLNYSSDKNIQALARVSRAISQSKFYRPLFTVYNLGFQSFNFVRDIRRAWRNMPKKTLAEVPLSPIIDAYKVLRGYGKAILPSKRRVLGQKDNLIKEMENAGILGLSYNDIYSGEIDPEQKQIERILEQTGVVAKIKKKTLLTPFIWVLDQVSTLGDFIETLPKVAGYIELKGSMPEAELAEFIRTSIGSPAFRVGGTATPITNSIFLFSNAIKEGIKSDIRIATGRKGKATSASFWYKTMISDLLPTLIMAMIAAGLFGDREKRLMDNVSEYDKTNYTIIPLGFDEKGKTIYIRIPHDETGRFLKGLFWKSLNINKDKDLIRSVFDIFAFNAGQLPNLSPSFKSIGAIITYLSGNNPYDDFRHRNVVPDTEFKAGFKESFPIFFDWLLKNQGLGIFYPSYKPQNPTSLEKTLNAPVISNILGRWIKVSDYGMVEQQKKITQEVEKQKAQELLKERKAVNEAIDSYKKNPSIINKINIEKKLIKQTVEPSGDKTKDKTKKTNILKKFRIGLIKGSGDTKINSLIDAGTNEEKIRLLFSIKNQISKSEFNSLLQTAKKEKIISKEVIKEYKKRLR